MLFYRIKVMGEVRGPWRPSRRLAERDAAGLNAGAFAEDGKFYLDVFAAIEEAHEYELKRRAAAAQIASCKTTPCRARRTAGRRA